MVDFRPSDAASPLSSAAAPAVKRKRLASCLGEQERRDRKRAIDREAQRSLREKTKAHIADLERTIEILRQQDSNGATASLLSEIDQLRAENVRLKEIIDSVRNLVGGPVASRNTTSVNASNGHGENGSSAANSITGQPSPRPFLPNDQRKSSTCIVDQKTSAETFTAPRCLDLDSMPVQAVMDPATANDLNLDMDINLELATVNDEEDVEEMPRNTQLAAPYAPLMEELFGPDWRLPSPTTLYIGNPDLRLPASIKVCPTWKRCNEVFGKVLTYRQPLSLSNSSRLFSAPQTSQAAEPGLLFLGIKQGWDTVPVERLQKCPAISILRQMDGLLFEHLPKIERLAVAYKSYKLLKYYLHATKEELDKVPEWLKPSPSQASTTHPIALDFFAWPTLRTRLLANHASIFQSTALSRAYSHHLHFAWPFSFEDAFFQDSRTGEYYPSPLFERYHGDLTFWGVKEGFYDTFPEMRSDIEGDKGRFGEGCGW
ncbi:repeatmulti-domain protein [Pyrenophora tritici-repentis]|uniref:DUF3425 domain containing protein n=1 Tax=Pyrenophora tritici-repentis TaxID=45151 RepID=A0A2W1EIH7_9PLEO|nr:DUF3425 multi-domain protein [Pyrenophora tritici-repentis]KAF7444592.1 DUF3425 multi-domain protein [Pyrenophora tritici-repentis]KAG9378841.1 DUF3425 multi-domain protein [Pyrenophora tritici-repentis]KAI1511157.1 DUF3425 domain containing protein [Pyrenophora tritici-repentis]KAI1549002.1 repeatmulti-domain protein [Pyrenophora tritici-repentis]